MHAYIFEKTKGRTENRNPLLDSKRLMTRFSPEMLAWLNLLRSALTTDRASPNLRSMKESFKDSTVIFSGPSHLSIKLKDGRVEGAALSTN